MTDIPTRLIVRADSHDRMTGGGHALGFYSSGDAKLMRDASAEIMRLRGEAAYDKCTIDFLKGDSRPDLMMRAIEALGVAQAAWMPIETAPKDGTDILVWPYWSDRQPAQVHWRDMKRTHGRWEITPSFYCAGAVPKHWRPLPASPVPSAQCECPVGMHSIGCKNR